MQNGVGADAPESPCRCMEGCSVRSIQLLTSSFVIWQPASSSIASSMFLRVYLMPIDTQEEEALLLLMPHGAWVVRVAWWCVVRGVVRGSVVRGVVRGSVVVQGDPRHFQMKRCNLVLRF